MLLLDISQAIGQISALTGRFLSSDSQLEMCDPARDIILLRTLTGGFSRQDGENLYTFINAYFSDFHPALPIIHKSTFDAGSTPHAMVKAMGAIGSMYTTSSTSDEDMKSQYRYEGQMMWKASCYELERLVSVDIKVYKCKLSISVRELLLIISHSDSRRSSEDQVFLGSGLMVVVHNLWHIQWRRQTNIQIT